MANRVLVSYKEPPTDGFTSYTLEIERSSAGSPRLIFIIRADSPDSSGDSGDEMCVFVRDGKKLLEPVLSWLNGN